MCGRVLEGCSCRPACETMLNCCRDYKQSCFQVSPHSSSMLGGRAIRILDLDLPSDGQLLCRFVINSSLVFWFVSSYLSSFKTPLINVCVYVCFCETSVSVFRSHKLRSKEECILLSIIITFFSSNMFMMTYIHITFYYKQQLKIQFLLLYNFKSKAV